MFSHSIVIARIAGIPIRLDASWFIVAVLITWSLAEHLFPEQHAGLDTASYWLMGAIGAAGLFASILLHEMGHALEARRHGLRIGSITLFIFGGVAELRDEPRDPASEFLVAIAGPLVSVLLALLALSATQILEGQDWVAAAVVSAWLCWINTALVLFNAVPAFPLDGGRVLRAGLWRWKRDLRWATRVTSSIGGGFGLALILIGIWIGIAGALISGLWFVLIGLFLRNAARSGYQQLLLRRIFEGEPVRRFMRDEVISVAPTLGLRELVENFIYQHHHKLFPVLDEDRLVGCITLDAVKQVHPEQWEQHSVRDLMRPCDDQNTIAPETDAMEALSRMNRTGQSRLLVAENGRLHGIVSLRDLLDLLALKIDLEEP